MKYKSLREREVISHDNFFSMRRDDCFYLYSTSAHVQYAVLAFFFLAVVLLDIFYFADFAGDYSFPGILRAIITSDFSIMPLGLVLFMVVAANFAISSALQLRVQFDRADQKLIWDKLAMNGRTLIVRDFSQIEALVLPKQRLLLPTPPFVELDDKILPLEQRRLWRGGAGSIRELAEFTDLPVIEK